MKHYIRFCLFFLILLLLCGCSSDPSANARGMYHPMQFYYCGIDSSNSAHYERNSGAMQWEYKDLGRDLPEVEDVVQMYMDGPVSNTLRTPVPEGTRVQGVSLKNGVLTITFNDAFSRLSGVEMTMAASGLVHTLTQYPGVGSVCLQTDASMVTGLLEKPLEPEDFIKQENIYNSDRTALRLYFPNRDGLYLRVETRSVQTELTNEILSFAIEQLISGSKSPAAAVALPSGTKLLKVENENGFCTVDFSHEFIQNAPVSSLEARLQLLSVVNTLTDVEEIKYVRFLCEGEAVSMYGPLELPVYLKREEASVESDDPAVMQALTLYIPSGREGRLAPVPVYVRKMSGDRMEAEVLKTLFEFEDANGYDNVIPKGTTVVDLQCKYRICSLTLSESFLSCDSDPAAAEKAVRSIVATLCGLETVDWVQIQVSGGEMSSVDLSKNLTVDENWIIP